MSPTVRHVAVLGAPQSGKTWLTEALTRALADTPDLTVTEHAPLQTTLAALPPGPGALAALCQAHRQAYDLTLLMGLDWPTTGDISAAVRESADAALRATLSEGGLAFKVLYGDGPQRLAHALLAIRGLAADAPASRTAAQYGLQGGRVAWRCENCSDPACEHQLFSRLLRG